MPDPRPRLPARDPRENSGEVNRAQAKQPRQSGLTGLADRQESVVSHEQLRALGFSIGEVHSRVCRGDLIPRHRGVFSLGRRRLTSHGHLHAALLAAGPRAALSHRSAAAVYGLRTINRFVIHLTVGTGSRLDRDNLRFHRSTTLHPSEVRTYSGFRVTTIARTLIDLAPDESIDELKRLITLAARKDLLDIDDLLATLDRHRRRPGTAKLRRALGDYVHVPRDKSTLERDFAAFLATDATIPPPQRNVHLEDTYEIDVYWPTQRLAVELDGRPYHQAVKERERDNAKDIWLQKRGLRIMRIRDHRFEYDRPGIRQDLHDFLDAYADADAA